MSPLAYYLVARLWYCCLNVANQSGDDDPSFSFAEDVHFGSAIPPIP
jgi:hypothetical protein